MKIKELSDKELIEQIMEIVDIEDKTIISILRAYKYWKKISPAQRNLLLTWLAEWKFDDPIGFERKMVIRNKLFEKAKDKYRNKS